MPGSWALLAVLVVGCSTNAAPSQQLAPRRLRLQGHVGTNGMSDALHFMVPAGSRSLHLSVQGWDDADYSLTTLLLAEGPSIAPQHYPRRGLVSYLHPNPPGGSAQLVVAGTRPGPIAIDIVAAADDGSRRLHLDLVGVGAPPPDIAAPLAAIFTGAGIDVVVDRVLTLAGPPPLGLDQQHEPHEVPESAAAQLPRRLGRGPAALAVPVFVVPVLPHGIAGLSLGTPGPATTDTYYSGVVVRQGLPSDITARTIAHEVSHYLGLLHPVDVATGIARDDQLADTDAITPNLMNGNADVWSPEQIRHLQASPWLR